MFRPKTKDQRLKTFQRTSKIFLRKILVYSLWSIVYSLNLVSFHIFAAAEEKIPVVLDAKQLTYKHQEGKIIAEGDVRMKHNDLELFCDYAEYNTNSYIAHIKGKLKIVKTEIEEAAVAPADAGVKESAESQKDISEEEHGESPEDRKEVPETESSPIAEEQVKKTSAIYGEDIVYDFNTGNARIVNIEMEDPPIYGKAKEGERIGNEKYLFKRGSYITTCDRKSPHYRITAKTMTIYPQDRVVAKNVFFKVGQVPILYLPYYAHSLKDEHFPIQVVPGKDEYLGYFVLNSYRYDLNKENRGKLYADWYDRRKWGLGVMHKTENPQVFGEALFKYYAIQDQAYDREVRGDLFKVYPEREGTSPKYLEDDRYKLQFAYDHEPLSGLSVKTEYNKFSDINFMKDFFFREYEVESHPRTYALLDYSLPGGALSLLTQKRANHFWSETEYLPQLEYTLFRRNLGTDSNFYLESTSAIGSLTNKSANSHQDSDVVRSHASNTLSYTDKIKWFYLNSSAGATTNFYSKDINGDENLYCGAFRSGSDLSIKLYKIFKAGFSLLGRRADLMRHVLTPQISYSYAHDPTIPASYIMSFDGKDSLSRAESAVFTLANKLQARNDKETWDFLYFSPAVNYTIHPEGAESRFTTVNTSLEVYPAKKISLSASKVYTVADRRITSVNVDLSLRGKIVHEQENVLSVGHRYSRHSDTQGTLNLRWYLIPKLQFKSYLRYEYNLEDFKERMFGFRADLHCWWVDFGVDIDKEKEGVNNHYFWIKFTLKAFSDTEVEFDHSYRGAKKRY